MSDRSPEIFFRIVYLLLTKIGEGITDALIDPPIVTRWETLRNTGKGRIVGK